MDCYDSNRRNFLIRFGGAAGAVFLQANWPAIAAAAQHAHQANKSTQAQTFRALTPEQAKEVDAITARIVPTDDQPGAREAGVVYFIDMALHTFASDAKPAYDQGLLEVNELVVKKFPGVKHFSDATTEQQDQILQELADRQAREQRRFARPPNAPPDFFQTIVTHTMFGFLVDPSAGGNRDYVGWKVAGRDPAPSFMPPFGFYDKDYAGWKPKTGETDKT